MLMGASTSHEAIFRHAEKLAKIATLTYLDFMASVEHLNLVAEQHVDPNGKRLLFAIKSNTAESILWKATVRIDCFKVNCASGSIETTRILSLQDFVILYDQIIQHLDTASINPEPLDFGSTDVDEGPLSTALDASMLLAKIDDRTVAFTGSTLTNPSPSTATGLSSGQSPLSSLTSQGEPECCICMERRSSIILPCTHAYCEKCIDSWCESHAHTCPLCRMKLKDKSDQWVLSEPPDALEMEKEVSSCMVGLAAAAGRPSGPEDHG